jgi:hypothetical protein
VEVGTVSIGRMRHHCLVGLLGYYSRLPEEVVDQSMLKRKKT